MPHRGIPEAEQETGATWRSTATPFNGKIELDVRDSTPDWAPFVPPRAPEGAPNVLIVLYDDTGLAAWEPFGGRIEMPTLKRLADNGLTLQPVAHHRAVLADPLVLPDRAQPPPERDGLHHRGRRSATRAAARHIPPECGDARPR